MIAREAIVATARSWVGTPYHHQASLKGVGCDCLGLIRGVWRECCGAEPEAMPAYTRDWGDATGSEPLLAAAVKHLVPLHDPSSAQAGDILVFRMKDRGVAKHAGILIRALPASGLLERDDALPASGLVERARLIHAQEELGVVDVEMGRWWRRRVVAAFQFPGVGAPSPSPFPPNDLLRKSGGKPSPRWGEEESCAGDAANSTSPLGGEVGARSAPGEGAPSRIRVE